MIVYKCINCGEETFERRAVCPKCRGEEFEEVDEKLGELVVETTLYVTPSSFPDKYTIAVLRAGTTRVLVRKE
ncbi:hypothetical protein HS1genome_2105 [Sulfodiicoccus acidiphilus]|uniref:ChsH2 rubredoxin-like zinc ribbon domain-containing protein n=1 Tax=Sulfodiicoccus acidiphilus TaxID=1670455 RepID=A0A348B6B4_9CREN|nr:zinc ribbon domain-containing protein [Sulfodiicoccus acidiphilus]BBD73716.1 hypothetical protein HS1genome_2105 [Sulfodiicoccus acidiphilus]GGT97835.1 hypothetical protein GCM10007116_14220 [Sulfodiicoccus acidiphilus]